MPRREKEPGFEDFSFRPWVPPALTKTRRADITRAAAAHVEANRSDPFSHGRVMLHMRRGIELPSDVLADANRILSARTSEKASD